MNTLPMCFFNNPEVLYRYKQKLNLKNMKTSQLKGLLMRSKHCEENICEPVNFLYQACDELEI